MHFVVVVNLTRFARDKYDHFALRSHLQSLGISLRSATEPIDDTSIGKLMEGVLPKARVDASEVGALRMQGPFLADAERRKLALGPPTRSSAAFQMAVRTIQETLMNGYL